MKIVRGGFIKHAQIDHRIFVTGESDVADLSCLLCIHYSFMRASLGEVSVRIFEPDVLVVLNQIDVVGLQALKRFIDLLRCRLLVVRKTFWR